MIPAKWYNGKSSLVRFDCNGWKISKIFWWGSLLWQAEIICFGGLYHTNFCEQNIISLVCNVCLLAELKPKGPQHPAKQLWVSVTWNVVLNNYCRDPFATIVFWKWLIFPIKLWLQFLFKCNFKLFGSIIRVARDHFHKQTHVTYM